MPDPPIKILPTSYQDVMTLLRSDALQSVEKVIAAHAKRQIIADDSAASIGYLQAEISVSGLTAAEIETLLSEQRETIERFGILFLRDQASSEDDEQQDGDETVEVLGLGAGFAAKYAIYYNFLANRTPAEFRAFLKHRRIRNQARFAKDLRRILDSVT